LKKLKQLSVIESLVGLVFVFLLLCVVMAAVTRSIGVSDDEIKDKAISLAEAKLQALSQKNVRLPSPYTHNESFLGGRIIRVVETNNHQTDPLIAKGMQKIVVTAIWVNLDGSQGRQDFITFVDDNVNEKIIDSANVKIQNRKQSKEIL
jgi:hypothetical protein